MASLVPVPGPVLMLEVVVLEGDPRLMENPVEQGDRAKVPLVGDESAVWWGKGREVESGHRVYACDDRIKNLAQPWVDMVLVEEWAKCQEEVRDMEASLRVWAAEEVGIVLRSTATGRGAVAGGG